jgi:hypothetical protein
MDINKAKFMGGKKKNGHKLKCTCHICKNMQNKAMRGEYEKEYVKEKEKKMGGSKKKNGHRMNCTCIICKNMKNSKKRYSNKLSRNKSKKRVGGKDPYYPSEEEKEEKEADEDPDANSINAVNENEDIDDTEDIDDNEELTPFKDDHEPSEETKDYDLDEDDEKEPQIAGKKSNNHKLNCKCPICKNMSKSKKKNINKKNKTKKNRK